MKLACEARHGGCVTRRAGSFTGMGRRHPLTMIIEQPAGQNGHAARAPLFMAAHLSVEFGLNGVEQLTLDDCRLFTGNSLPLEHHPSAFAAVSGCQEVPQQSFVDADC